MRKLITSVLIASTLIATPALAHDRHGRDHHHHRTERNEPRNGPGWVVPLVGGIIIGVIVADSNNDNRRYQDRYYNPYAQDLDPRYYNPRCATEQFTDRYGIYYRRICR
jgi:hypothetical protein